MGLANMFQIDQLDFSGEGKEGYIHHIWSGVHWGMWNTWQEILVNTTIFLVNRRTYLVNTKIFLINTTIFLINTKIFVLKIFLGSLIYIWQHTKYLW